MSATRHICTWCKLRYPTAERALRCCEDIKKVGLNYGTTPNGYHCTVCWLNYPTIAGAANCCRHQDKEADPVNSPSHYNQGKIETIEIIRDKLTPEEFEGYCKGNAMKYVTRARHKGRSKEDLQKAVWYLNYLCREDDGE